MTAIDQPAAFPEPTELTAAEFHDAIGHFVTGTPLLHWRGAYTSLGGA